MLIKLQDCVEMNSGLQLFSETGHFRHLDNLAVFLRNHLGADSF